MPEQYANLASTTVATGGYTSGSGVLNVASTGGDFPASAPFSVVIQSQLTGSVIVVLRVTAINSGTQFAVTPETADSSALSGDNVYAIVSVLTLDGIRADINKTGTFANIPTSGMKKGDRYKCTDSPYECIFNGSTWEYYVLGYQVKPPTLAAFSWTNQASASAVDTYGGIILALNNANSGIRILDQAAISAPFVVDVAIMHWMAYDTTNMYGFIGRESGSGKLIGFGNYADNSIRQSNFWGLDKFNSPSSFNANYLTLYEPCYGPILWLRYYDDGTNRLFSYSSDGRFWRPFFGGAGQGGGSNTDFCVFDRVGFGINIGSSSYQSRPSMSVLHFNQYSGAPPAYGYPV